MNKKINKDKWELIINTKTDSNVWKENQKKALEIFSKSLFVKGFRKGKVPQKIAEKYIDKNRIFAKATTLSMDHLLEKASHEIVDEFVLTQPQYNVKSISSKELEIDFIYPIFPQINVTNYKNLKSKYKEKKVSPNDVKEEIEKLLKDFAMIEIKNGPIEKGDIAIIDFKGFVDNKEFLGGVGNDFELTIGSKTFIDNFEEQLINLKKGENKEIHVTFPKDYHVPNLQNKKALFKVDIKEVKKINYPKLDDEFVSKNLKIENVKTVYQLEKYIENLLKNEYKQKAREKFEIDAFEEMRQKVDFNISNILIQKEIDNMKNNLLKELKQKNINLLDWLKSENLDQKSFADLIFKNATIKLKNSVIYATIAKQEKIEANKEEYDEQFKKLAKVYGHSLESIKKTITPEQIQVLIINNKVIDFLISISK